MIEKLPAVNASLNALATVFLIAGWRMVRTERIAAHKRFMIAALTTSALFLTSYLVYHYATGHTEFTHQGWPRKIYFAILATHVPLAALMVLPILWVAWLGFHDEVAKHRRLARWVLPIWLYVSVTGVVIYFMLYHLYPPSSAG